MVSAPASRDAAAIAAAGVSQWRATLVSVMIASFDGVPSAPRIAAGSSRSPTVIG
jgi:hypothetical protein